ncbi:MAG: hypothetical protein SNG97_06870 [Rikenellaceae bacterium]
MEMIEAIEAIGRVGGLAGISALVGAIGVAIGRLCAMPNEHKSAQLDNDKKQIDIVNDRWQGIIEKQDKERDKLTERYERDREKYVAENDMLRDRLRQKSDQITELYAKIQKLMVKVSSLTSHNAFLEATKCIKACDDRDPPHDAEKVLKEIAAEDILKD